MRIVNPSGNIFMDFQDKRKAEDLINKGWKEAKERKQQKQDGGKSIKNPNA